MSVSIQQDTGSKVSREIARNCLLTRTRQISRVVTAIYDEAMRPFGINSSQFTLLVLIMELGPLSRSDLGRRNHHDRSTLTRNLQPLISQGWVSEGLSVASERRIGMVRRAKQSQGGPGRGGCACAHGDRGRLAPPYDLIFFNHCCICNTTWAR
jgi:DNA-binding MarR family transcriptional regulator